MSILILILAVAMLLAATGSLAWMAICEMPSFDGITALIEAVLILLTTIGMVWEALSTHLWM